MGAAPRIHLPLYVRCLCLLIMTMLIVSTGVEMFMIVQGWMQARRSTVSWRPTVTITQN
jgi:hypothetical protein